MTRTPVAIPMESYYRRRFPLAFLFLDLYQYWWSARRLRFAVHGALLAERKGLPPIVELDDDF